MTVPDILIIGAGPVGLATSLALHHHGIAARVADAGHAKTDTRVLALSEGTRQIVHRLHAWPVGTTPITDIHISQQGGFGRTQLAARDNALAALGHVVPAATLHAALAGACERVGIAIEYGTHITHSTLADDHILAHTQTGATLPAKLLVRAEGTLSDDADIITRDYQQDAILCTVTPKQPHSNRAYERFTAHGPVALLPLAHEFSLVATVARDDAEAVLTEPEPAFLSRINALLGNRVSLTHAGPRQRYPLRLRYRKQLTAPRTVWLGNAAQTLHPVAGQGFNLALRDVWSLVTLLAAHPKADPGSPAVLGHYPATRHVDRFGTVGFTDTLIHAFSTPLLSPPRGLGLLALDTLPALRRFVARRMMLGARGL